MKNTFENFDLNSSLELLDKLSGMSHIDVRNISGIRVKKTHGKTTKPVKK